MTGARRRKLGAMYARMMTGAHGLEAESLRLLALRLAAIVDDPDARPADVIRAAVELRSTVQAYGALVAEQGRRQAEAWGASQLRAL